MENSETRFVHIIKEICREEEILLTSFDDWAFVLQKGDRETAIYGYQFGLDRAVHTMMVKDKACASDRMEQCHIPHVPHTCLMNPNRPEFAPKNGTYVPLLAALETYHTLVLKDNLGTGGYHVLKASNVRELEFAAGEIFQSAQSLAYCPYVEIEAEYRLVMLTGKCVMAFEKLRQNGNWRHNLGQGAKPRVLSSTEITPEMLSLAGKVCEAFSLRFCSVDLIKTKEGLMVLEVNNGVMMENLAGASPELFERVKDIYRQAIRLSLSEEV